MSACLRCGSTSGLCLCDALPADALEQLRSAATPKEPAAPPAAALLSREELEGMRGLEEADEIWLRRLVATARAGIEARELLAHERKHKAHNSWVDGYEQGRRDASR